MSPSERAEVEQRIAPRLADRGDHTRIVVENLTNEPVSIHLNKNTVVGPSKESLRGVPVAAISSSGSPEAIQKQIWKIRTRTHQDVLTELGFSQGAQSGDLNTATVHAIAEFQATEGLHITGRIDPDTESRLNNSLEDQRTLASFNKAKKSGWVEAIVQTGLVAPHQSFYRISFVDGDFLYTDSIPEIRRKTIEKSSKTEANSAYLIADLPDNSRDALEASIHISELLHDDSLDIRVVERQSSEPIKTDEFFSRQIKNITDDAAEPQMMPGAPDDLVYQKNVIVEFRDGTEKALTIYGRTKAAVTTFIANLKDAIAYVNATLGSTDFRLLYHLRFSDLYDLGQTYFNCSDKVGIVASSRLSS